MSKKVVSGLTVFADHFRNLIRHAWCKGFQEASGNVAPCGEDGFTKVWTDIQFWMPSIPKHSQWNLDRGNMQDVAKEWYSPGRSPLSVVNYSIVLLKDPVIATQMGVLSQQECLLQHVYIASRRFDATTQPEAPLFHWRKKRPRSWWRPLLCAAWKTHWKPSGPSRLNFLLSENKTFSHLSVSHVWCSLAKSKWASLWRGRRHGLWRHFLFFFSQILSYALLGCSQNQHNLGQPVSSWTSLLILWLTVYNLTFLSVASCVRSCLCSPTIVQCSTSESPFAFAVRRSWQCECLNENDVEARFLHKFGLFKDMVLNFWSADEQSLWV